MSEELQEIVVSDWSDYDPGDHEEIKRIIKNNINSVCANYVAIGFYLNVVNDKKLFQDDGYSGIGDYAKAEYGIEKDKCSYLMKIARRFCIPNSPALLPEYRGFKVEKLRAMVYLTDEQLEQVSITTTRAEIRNMKKPEPEKVEPAQLEAEPEKIEPTQPESKGLILDCYNPEEGWHKELILDEAESDQSESIKQYDKAKEILDHMMSEEWCSLVIWRRFLEKDIAEKGKEEACEDFLSFHGGHGQALKAENGHPKFEFMLYKSQGDTPGKIELQWDNDKTEMPTDEFMELYLNYPVLDGEKPNDIPAPVNDEPEIMDNQPVIVNDVDEDIIPDKGCNNCKYNDMTPEQFKAIDPGGGLPCNICDDKLDQWEPKIDANRNIVEKSDFPCDTCGHDINGCCDYDDENDWCEMGSAWIPKGEESEQVETVEAEIIQTVPEDPERYTFQDVKDEHDKLTEYVDTFRRNDDTVPGRRKAKMRLDAITLLSEEMQKPTVVEEPEPIQPELPILKNNDQRKEWAENYKAWGEWYYDEHIDCHYYKYDFPNGDRLVVEEYLNRCAYWGHEANRCHYHLLQKNKPAYEKNKSFEQKYVHSESSMTEIVEYLKGLQKKGA